MPAVREAIVAGIPTSRDRLFRGNRHLQLATQEPSCDADFGPPTLQGHDSRRRERADFGREVLVLASAYGLLQLREFFDSDISSPAAL